jgi:hypothetical protein
MLRLFALLLLTAMTTINPHEPSIPPNPIQSKEVQSLKSESEDLKKARADLRNKADRWNDWYMGLAAGAVIAGVFSWGFQRHKDTLTGKAQTLTDQIEAKDERIKEIQDAEYKSASDAAAIEIGNAQREAGEANAKAEREKLERQKLEVLVSPRRLTIEQQKEIGLACLALYGKRVSISSYGTDPEGKVLAIQIGYALAFSKIRVHLDPGGPVTSGGLDTGIDIRGPEEEENFTSCLAHALSDIGKLKDVRVNGERHTGTTMSGATMRGGATVMSGGGSIRPAAPLPAGSPVEIFVGIRPIEIPIIGK